ncbi:MAG: DUF58 domain-containing protein [Dehalococcoidales bacterium]|nr:DUF58 domain-containing protein [Dehalococcoidales bacterium]
MAHRKPVERLITSQTTSYLLGKYSLIIMLTGLIIAAWNGKVLIVVLLGLILSAAGLAKLYSYLSLVRVHCQHSLDCQRVFPGECVEVNMRVVNYKPLPLPWLKVDSKIPAGLTSETSPEQDGTLSKVIALLWYARASWQHKLVCPRRGYYLLGPIRITSGDIFGFYRRTRLKKVSDSIIVYPRIFAINERVIPSRYPLGESRAAQHIFRDPSRVIGIRDYTPQDSPRYIHWKATAIHQKLQVKVFEPTTNPKLALILDLESFGYDGVGNERTGSPSGKTDELFETALSTAASLVKHFIEHKSAVGLFVNTRLADSGRPAVIPPGSGTGHLVSILEALAKVTPLSSGLLTELIQGERKHLPWGTTLIFVLSQPTASASRLLSSSNKRGHKSVTIFTGDHDWQENDTPNQSEAVGVTAKEEIR